MVYEYVGNIMFLFPNLTLNLIKMIQQNAQYYIIANYHKLQYIGFYRLQINVKAPYVFRL